MLTKDLKILYVAFEAYDGIFKTLRACLKIACLKLFSACLGGVSLPPKSQCEAADSQSLAFEGWGHGSIKSQTILPHSLGRKLGFGA